SVDPSGLARTATSCIYGCGARLSLRVAAKPGWPKSRYAPVSPIKVICGGGADGDTAVLSRRWLACPQPDRRNLHECTFPSPQIAAFRELPRDQQMGEPSWSECLG